MLIVSGCKDRDESLVKSFLDRPVEGMIDGKEFEMLYAYVDPTIETQNENDYVFIFLPVKPEKACPGETDIDEDVPIAMAPAPKKKKKNFKLRGGTARTMVYQFMQGDDQIALAAKKGKIMLTSITASKIKGKIFARYNSDTWLNGTFSAYRCEWKDFK
jgi:hypothetical protein